MIHTEPCIDFVALGSHNFGPLCVGTATATEHEYPAHQVCLTCGLSNIYLESWPQSCKGNSPVKKETKMITRLNIHVDAAPSAQEEQRLDIPVFAKTVPHSNGAQIALYARIAGTEVPLVGLLISRDSGKLVATRWVTGSVADEFVERDTAGRIKDRWANETQ